MPDNTPTLAPLPAIVDKRLSWRFWIRVYVTEGGCWSWQGSLHKGYGRFNRRLAHKYSYETIVGTYPIGKQADHICRNRACVNPTHLEMVTGRTNVIRGYSPAGINARRTHCASGHLLAGYNVRVDGSRRICRACKRLRARTYYWDRK